MILINEKNFFSNFLFNDLLKLSNDLKKLQKYDESNFIKEMSLCCDEYISEILEEPYTETSSFNVKNTDLFVIEQETLKMLSYNNLKFFNYLYYTLYIKERNNINLYEFKLSEKIINEKESIIKSGLYTLEDMTLEEFQILMELASTNALEWYAIDCGVEFEELTPEIMYDKYHKKNILKRC